MYNMDSGGGGGAVIMNSKMFLFLVQQAEPVPVIETIPPQDPWLEMFEVTNPASDTPYNLEDVISRLMLAHKEIESLFMSENGNSSVANLTEEKTVEQMKFAMRISTNILNTNL